MTERRAAMMRESGTCLSELVHSLGVVVVSALTKPF